MTHISHTLLAYADKRARQARAKEQAGNYQAARALHAAALELYCEARLCRAFEDDDEQSIMVALS